MIRKILGTRTKISRKIFLYTCGILVFNFLLLFFISSAWLKNFALNEKEEYLKDVYSQLLTQNYNDEQFLNEVDSIQYENIYIEIYDSEENDIVYTNTGYVSGIEQEDIQPILEKIDSPDTSDCIICYPSSEYENDIYSMTGRQQQITVIGKYMSSDSSMYLVVQTPYQPIVDIVSVVQRFSLLASIVALIISFLPSVWFAYFFSKPIHEATQMARAIKNKDFSQRCIIRTNDEISELEETMNTMADSINVYTEELESANESLTNDINNRKQLEKTQREFVSNVSHEIKTPISIISGYAEAIKKGIAQTEEEKAEFCDIIVEECDRMTNIVVDLLSISKLENGTLELDYSDFSAKEMCENIISKFKLKCDEQNIQIVLDCKEDCMVIADYNEIERVIINYVQNAYKHVSDNGTITLTVKKDGEYIYIGVNNDGGHISEKELSNIWNKFYKIDKSHKREENSTGLGLSIVKATMDLHKMPYGAKNTENGVEFYIKLKKPDMYIEEKDTTQNITDYADNA